MDSVQDRLAAGFPHSDIHGSKPARGSPWLFAACHVLHRLSVPRHPPDALLMLDPRRFLLSLSIEQDAIPRAGANPHTTDRHPAPIRTLPDPGTPTTAKADTRKTRPGPRFTSPLHMSKIRRRPKANAPPHAPVSSGGTWIMAGKQGTASRGDERRQMPSGPEGPGKPAGGGERDRTDDLMLAKHALSQLSYAPEDRLRPSSGSSRCAIRFAPLKRKTRTHQTSKPTGRNQRQPIQQRADRRGSRRAKPDRPCDPRTGGAPAKLVGQGGLEPPTSRLSSARSNQLSY